MKKSFLRRNLSLVVLFLFPVYLSAQQSLPEDVLSPNASDLGRYGDIPMNYFTGRANVTIPLFETEQRGVPLNIYLSYDTGGLLMNSLPGWTGHGWTLNAGGCITRVMQGECDEYVFPEGFDTQHNVNTSNYVNYFHSCSTYNNSISSSPGEFSEDVRLYKMDSAPDVFVFNFMGKTGRFFLGPDKQWKVVSDENIDVVFDVDDNSNYIAPFYPHFPGHSNVAQPKTIKGFTLIDEDGTRYIFGGETEGDTDAIEYTIPFFGMRKNDMQIGLMANAWYLTRVEDRFGNELYRFVYQRGKFIIPVSIAYEYSKVSTTYFVWTGHHNFHSGSIISNNYLFPFSVSVNSPVYLQKIILPNENTINFTKNTNIRLSAADLYNTIFSYYNTPQKPLYTVLAKQTEKMGLPLTLKGASYLYPYFYIPELQSLTWDGFSGVPLNAMEINPLGEMTINDTEDELLRKFIFCYETSPRLHMTGVNIFDSSESTLSKYHFKYNNYSNVPSDYLTRATDHWGYYNNQNGPNGFTLNLFMNANDSFFVPFINRKQPNEAATKLGTLSEILYPTGGKTVFDYEINDYDLYMSEDRQSVHSLSENLLRNPPITPPPGGEGDEGNDEEEIDPSDATYIPDGIAGGLRIKSITEYDDTLGTKMLKRRSFSYINPSTNHSSGILFAQPRYYWPGRVLINNSYDFCFVSTFRTTSIAPLSNSFGTHIGYSYVTEIYEDGTSKQFRFSNVSDEMLHDGLFEGSFMGPGLSAFDKYNERDFLRGRLLSERTSDCNGDEVSSTEYQYELLSDSCVLSSNFFYLSHDSVWPPDENRYTAPLGVIYKMSYPKYTVRQYTKRINTSEEDFTETVSLKNRTDYLPVSFSYPHYQTVLKCVADTVTRASDRIIHQYSYPLTDTCFTSKFFLPLTATTTFLNGNRIGYKGTMYSYHNTGSGLTFAPAYEVQGRIGNNGYCLAEEVDTLITYDKYLSNGRFLKYTDRSGIPTHLKWSDDGNYLLAKVRSSQANPSFTYNAGATDPKQRLLLNGTSVFSLSETEASVYTYDSFGNVTSVTSSNGQRLACIKDTNGKTLQRFTYHYSSGTN